MIKNLVWVAKKVPRKILNSFLKFSNETVTPTITQSRDTRLIKELKRKFEHSIRPFFHGLDSHSVDCLYCHAVPGTIETIILELDRLVKEDKKRAELLNLGGGAGQTSAIFRALGFDVFNLDIEVEKEGKRSVRFDLNKPGDLPYPKESFDVVICQEIIEHIENPWDLFRKTKGILKPGGYLIVTTPNVQSNYSKRKFLETGYFHWFAPENFSYHINFLPTWEVEMIAEKVGFEFRLIKGNGQYYFDRDWQSSRDDIIAENEVLIYLFQKKP